MARRREGEGEGSGRTREALAGVGGDTSETGAEGRNESRNEKIPSQSRIEIGGKLFSD